MIHELEQSNLGMDPLENFNNWHKDAALLEDNADAMTLSTFDFDQNRPVSRSILFKGLIDGKFIFYTNYLSRKAEHLDKNPEVCLLFYWMRSLHQIRIQGQVSKMAEVDSANYFYSRDFDSQLASYISKQSHPIPSKSELVNKFENAKMEFLGKVVPKPPHWGGYLIEPYEFEFFIYGPMIFPKYI